MEHFIWSDDRKGDPKYFKAKEITKIQIPTIKKEIQQIFVHNNCTLFLSFGQLFKQGYFNWEDNIHESVPTLINFPSHPTDPNPSINFIAFGDNHIIALSTANCMYSWGDNYYGQLGIGNYMLAKLHEPYCIKHNDKIKAIFAYKNNSFCIDMDSKLLVWGRCEFLGGNNKGNRFKPMKILNQYNVDRLKIQNDRIIVRVKTEFIREEDVDLEDVFNQRYLFII
jgi:alpha-tubulin suppressor-like RCC1 family protein